MRGEAVFGGAGAVGAIQGTEPGLMVSHVMLPIYDISGRVRKMLSLLRLAVRMPYLIFRVVWGILRILAKHCAPAVKSSRYRAVEGNVRPRLEVGPLYESRRLLVEEASSRAQLTLESESAARAWLKDECESGLSRMRGAGIRALSKDECKAGCETQRLIEEEARVRARLMFETESELSQVRAEVRAQLMLKIEAGRISRRLFWKESPFFRRATIPPELESIRDQAHRLVGRRLSYMNVQPGSVARDPEGNLLATDGWVIDELCCVVELDVVPPVPGEAYRMLYWRDYRLYRVVRLKAQDLLPPARLGWVEMIEGLRGREAPRASEDRFIYAAMESASDLIWRELRASIAPFIDIETASSNLWWEAHMNKLPSPAPVPAQRPGDPEESAAAAPIPPKTWAIYCRTSGSANLVEAALLSPPAAVSAKGLSEIRGTSRGSSAEVSFLGSPSTEASSLGSPADPGGNLASRLVERDIAMELARQRAVCIEYAKKQGLTPVAGPKQIFTDSCRGSANPDNRPGLQALVASGASGILCEDRQRLAPTEYSALMEGWLAARGLELLTVASWQ